MTDDDPVPIHDEGECNECDAIRAQLTAESKAWMIGHPIPTPNRWAAFTDMEIPIIGEELERRLMGDKSQPTTGRLTAEIAAELERRKT